MAHSETDGKTQHWELLPVRRDLHGRIFDYLLEIGDTAPEDTDEEMQDAVDYWLEAMFDAYVLLRKHQSYDGATLAHVLADMGSSIDEDVANGDTLEQAACRQDLRELLSAVLRKHFELHEVHGG